MVRVGYAAVLVAVCFLCVGASAQQQSKPRVFTNDDVYQAPPPPPPPPTAPAEKTTTDKTAVPEPGKETVAATPATAGPPDEIKKVKDLQAVLKQFLDVYVDKTQAENNPDRKQRLVAMTDSIKSLLQNSESVLNDLIRAAQEKAK